MFHPVLNIKISAIAEEVYSQLGPGLPDSIYKESFIHELEDSDLHYEKDPFIPIDYRGNILDSALHACFIIENKIVLYVKSSSKNPDHYKNKLHNFMRLSPKRCGMIIDFNNSSFSEVLRVFMV